MIRHTLVIIILYCYVLKFSNSSPVNSDGDLKKILLKLHNDARKQVLDGKLLGQPAAQEIDDLIWDDDLASGAQRLADRCIIGHDTNADRRTNMFANVGQNWAGNPSIEEGFKSWLDESSSYNFEKNQCSSMCGHYTQLIWAESTHLGCGITYCGTGSGFPYGYSIVCNYGPAGNMMGERPYRASDSKSSTAPAVNGALNAGGCPNNQQLAQSKPNPYIAPTSSLVSQPGPIYGQQTIPYFGGQPSYSPPNYPSQYQALQPYYPPSQQQWYNPYSYQPYPGSRYS